jgi:hypothetical protein
MNRNGMDLTDMSQELLLKIATIEKRHTTGVGLTSPYKDILLTDLSTAKRRNRKRTIVGFVMKVFGTRLIKLCNKIEKYGMKQAASRSGDESFILRLKFKHHGGKSFTFHTNSIFPDISNNPS